MSLVDNDFCARGTGYAICRISMDFKLFNLVGNVLKKIYILVVFDQISEHALISEPPFLKLKKKKSSNFFFFNFFFFF